LSSSSDSCLRFIEEERLEASISSELVIEEGVPVDQMVQLPAADHDVLSTATIPDSHIEDDAAAAALMGDDSQSREATTAAAGMFVKLAPEQEPSPMSSPVSRKPAAKRPPGEFALEL